MSSRDSAEFGTAADRLPTARRERAASPVVSPMRRAKERPMTKRLLAIPLALMLAVLASGCIITSEEDSSLTIDNASSYALYEIRVAEEFDDFYGPDLLGSDILLPGESITVLLDCGTYDVLVVDEDGFECELLGLDLCFDDAVWVVDNTTLNTCGF
jgi:hypothetical protein